MTVDLSPIESAAISLAAVALSTFGTWALYRLADLFHISRQNVAIQGFDNALVKSVQAGAGAVNDEIKAKGWDHVDVKSSIVALAAPYAMAKFAPALKSIGLDPADPGGATTRYLTDELNRIFPTAMIPVAQSPVTPPSPPGTTADDLNIAELSNLKG